MQGHNLSNATIKKLLWDCLVESWLPATQFISDLRMTGNSQGTAIWNHVDNLSTIPPSSEEICWSGTRHDFLINVILHIGRLSAWYGIHWKCWNSLFTKSSRAKWDFASHKTKTPITHWAELGFLVHCTLEVFTRGCFGAPHSRNVFAKGHLVCCCCFGLFFFFCS